MLATEIESPRTSAPPIPQPNARPSAVPSTVANEIWTAAPGTAMFLTARRSRNEKWMPTTNIRRMRPPRAPWATARSAIRPGVKGPMTTPAAM